MSPRKSSTSSGRHRSARPRYLGLEVVGEPFPSSSREWENLLREHLDRSGLERLEFRLIRTDGRRAVIEVGHLETAAVRAAFAEPGPPGERSRATTRRTWGTLVGAKAWLRKREGNAARRSI